MRINYFVKFNDGEIFEVKGFDIYEAAESALEERQFSIGDVEINTRYDVLVNVPGSDKQNRVSVVAKTGEWVYDSYDTKA